MSKVFNDLIYAAQYEQVNLDLDNIYGQIARKSIDLAKIPKESKILDIGCGTGIYLTPLEQILDLIMSL